MPVAMTMTETGLALILLSMLLTRRSQRQAIMLHGAAVGAWLAGTPGTGVVPAWVSLMNVAGWAVALSAGMWSTLDLLS